MITIHRHEMISVSDLLDYAVQRAAELTKQAMALPPGSDEISSLVAKASGMLMMAQEIGIEAVKAKLEREGESVQ